MPLGRTLERVGGHSMQTVAKAGLLAISSRFPVGTNIFTKEWDLLIVLDTCRPDALEAVADEYDFLPEDVPTIWSVGSSTREWVGNSFTPAHETALRDTAVITANTALYYGLRDKSWDIQAPLVRQFADWDIVDETALGLHDPLWKYAPSDPWTGLPVPAAVTDRAVSVGRDLGPVRCLVHYLAPHTPYRAGSLTENRPPTAMERDPWQALRNGTDTETVWQLYLDELRFVLSEVETLLDNYDADRVIITADHGELFGELNLYSHPSGVPHPNLRRVPWVETTATDTGEYAPQLSGDETGLDPDVESQLDELGYL